jgi:hypothetical protein
MCLTGGHSEFQPRQKNQRQKYEKPNVCRRKREGLLPARRRTTDFSLPFVLGELSERDPLPLDYARSPSIIAGMAEEASAHPH